MPSPSVLRACALLAALVAVGACGSSISSVRPSPPSSPRDAYLRSLAAAGLADRELYAAWRAAAERALASSIAVAPPYRESGYFDPARPVAVALAVDLVRGEELVVGVSTVPADLGLFLELLDGSGSVVAAATGGSLHHRPGRAGRFTLLAQPELLAGGRYTLDLVARGALLFPVADEGRPRLIGGFGDPRDGGRRLHEGLDIGAARGTPALAAADGWVTRVSENPLGGRVVYLETDSGLSLYYAHLDRQAVRNGERVRRGDVLGRVGDTGNARGTTPHLHFEVRVGDVGLDPAPWIRRPPPVAPVGADVSATGRWLKVSREGSRLRAGPGTDFEILDELPHHLPAQVLAASRDMYRIELVDGRQGFTAAFLLSPPDAVLRTIPLVGSQELRAGPSGSAPPVARVDAGEGVGVLAQAGETILVRATTGAEGWMELP